MFHRRTFLEGIFPFLALTKLKSESKPKPKFGPKLKPKRIEGVYVDFCDNYGNPRYRANVFENGGDGKYVAIYKAKKRMKFKANACQLVMHGQKIGALRRGEETFADLYPEECVFWEFEIN